MNNRMFSFFPKNEIGSLDFFLSLTLQKMKWIFVQTGQIHAQGNTFKLQTFHFQSYLTIVPLVCFEHDMTRDVWYQESGDGSRFFCGLTYDRIVFWRAYIRFYRSKEACIFPPCSCIFSTSLLWCVYQYLVCPSKHNWNSHSSSEKNKR